MKDTASEAIAFWGENMGLLPIWLYLDDPERLVGIGWMGLLLIWRD